jgi:hypothetical protein
MNKLMKTKLTLLALVSLSALPSAHANEDLSLPGERWLAEFTGYICQAYGPAAERPRALDTLNVQFTRMTSDQTLDNGLIKATFEQDGATCRYSALMFADNAAQTIRLVESRAFAQDSNVDCSAGQAVIDAGLRDTNKYLYFGHPHNLTIMAAFPGAAEACSGAELVGVNFVVKGRVAPPTAN